MKEFLIRSLKGILLISLGIVGLFSILAGVMWLLLLGTIGYIILTVIIITGYGIAIGNKLF